MLVKELHIILEEEDHQGKASQSGQMKPEKRNAKNISKGDSMVFRASRGFLLERRAKKIFGITSNPINSGFITSDGKYLNFGKGFENTPDLYHLRICRAYIKRPIACENRYLTDTNNIRTQISRDNASFELRHHPNKNQLEAIERASKGKEIFIDFTNNEGETLKSNHFKDFNQAKDWLNKNVL